MNSVRGWKRFLFSSPAIAGFLPAIFVFGLLVVPAFSTQPPAEKPDGKPAPPAIAADLEKRTVDELIDKLQEESNLGVNLRIYDRMWTDYGDTFMGLHSKPRFDRLSFGSHGSQPAPVVWELVRRGLQSLPKLLDHLEDKRVTKLVLTADDFLGRVSYQIPGEMECLEVQPAEPAGFKTVAGTMNDLRVVEYDEARRWHYTIKVGDLCYVAIGQIVNRTLHPVMGGRESTIFLNSPVHLPGVASACRKEWGGLTAEKHRNSLINDCFDPRSGSAPVLGLTRLYFYYPQEGEKRIIDQIKRPLGVEFPFVDYLRDRLLYLSQDERDGFESVGSAIVLFHNLMDNGIVHLLSTRMIRPVDSFYFLKMNRWVKETSNYPLFMATVTTPSIDEIKWELNDFEKRYGKGIASQLPARIYREYFREDLFIDSAFFWATKYKGRIILRKAFAKNHQYKHQFVNRATRDERGYFLMALPDFANKNIDRAIYELYKKAAEPGIEEDSSIANSCIRLLGDKGHNAEFRDYLESWIAAAKKQGDPMKEWVIDSSQDLLETLKK